MKELIGEYITALKINEDQSILPMSEIDNLLQRLRSAPQWWRHEYGEKVGAEPDTAPFEAADEIELLVAKINELHTRAENLAPGVSVEAIHIGYQQRQIFEDEEPSIWQFCDDQTAKILKNRNDYELKKVFVISIQQSNC